MEETKTLDLSNRPIDIKNFGNDPSCPTWIFANENSADNDLHKVLEVQVDEKKD